MKKRTIRPSHALLKYLHDKRGLHNGLRNESNFKHLSVGVHDFIIDNTIIKDRGFHIFDVLI